MSVKWTDEQQQVIDLRNRNSGFRGSRFRKDGCIGGADFFYADRS